MAALEVIALDTATPQLRAPGASDTYTFPRAVEMPLGTANGVLYLNGSKVVTSGSALTFDGTTLATTNVKLASSGSIVDGGGNAVLTPTSGGSVALTSNGSYTNGNIVYNALAATGVHVFSVNSSEQMRLNSTGLGIGTSSPTNKLTVAAPNAKQNIVSTTGTNEVVLFLQNTGGDFYIGRENSAGTYFSAPAYSANLFSGGAYPMLFWTNSTERMRLDSSGNLGLGVTPSAATLGPAFQINNGAVLQSLSGGYTELSSNAIYNSGFKYISSSTATLYEQGAGAHKWFTAPSGTAGNAISFTQAMTLDSSGRLGVGTTSPSNIGVTAESTGSNSVYFTANNTTGYNFIAGVATAAGYGLLGMTTNHPLLFITNNTERARIPAAGGMVVGTAALATTATDGFLYVPTCAGTPTGTPTTQTGTAPIVVDTTNNKLYFYSGGQWRDAGP